MKVGLWVLAGIVLFLIIEKVFAEEGEHDHVSQYINRLLMNNEKDEFVVLKIHPISWYDL